MSNPEIEAIKARVDAGLAAHEPEKDLRALLAEVRRLTDALATADARLREMGSREEDLEAEIERLAAVEAGVEERVKAARLDGARAMRDVVSEHCADAEDEHQRSGDIGEAVAIYSLGEKIRTLDPAAVVGSGS